MSGHTKGPWHSEIGGLHEVRDSEGGRICILTQLRGKYGMRGRRPDGESEANAHLMAAAPALLDVLKEMVKDAVFTELCQSIGEEPEWLKKARREIAKVEVA